MIANKSEYHVPAFRVYARGTSPITFHEITFKGKIILFKPWNRHVPQIAQVLHMIETANAVWNSESLRGAGKNGQEDLLHRLTRPFMIFRSEEIKYYY